MQKGLSLLANGVATLGVGHLPKAPGTWGSLLAVIIWWFLLPLGWGSRFILIFSAFFIGWLATHYYEKWNDKHDPKEVVVDELVGMWITASVTFYVWWLFVLAFIFFRVFDIWKPFPIGWIDKNVPGALGTMLDDVAAGLIAGGLAFLCSKVYFLWYFGQL